MAIGQGPRYATKPTWTTCYCGMVAECRQNPRDRGTFRSLPLPRLSCTPRDRSLLLASPEEGAPSASDGLNAPRTGPRRARRGAALGRMPFRMRWLFFVCRGPRFFWILSERTISMDRDYLRKYRSPLLARIVVLAMEISQRRRQVCLVFIPVFGATSVGDVRR